jgi:RimJ/RimL family protein N-acetyltransferase
MGEHFDFIANKPYEQWYLIESDDEILGTIYLTKRREVGISVFKEHRGKGIGDWALKELQKKHPGPLYANINPANTPSKRFFEGHGFKHIQDTYILT